MPGVGEGSTGRGSGMTVEEFKKELDFYDDDMEVVFMVSDDFEPDSVTEDRWGTRTARINAKVKPFYMSKMCGTMLIELEKDNG